MAIKKLRRETPEAPSIHGLRRRTKPQIIFTRVLIGLLTSFNYIFSCTDFVNYVLTP